MDLFLAAGVGRETNDAANKVREEILATLYHSTDTQLAPLRDAWKTFLSTLCPLPYDDVHAVRKGGRSANHDFNLTFLADSAPILSVKTEFKHNARTLEKLPQYFSPAADKPYFPRLYADVFYDDFLDRACQVYPGVADLKPSKETYLRLVYNDTYDRHPFFRAFYDAETNGTREQYKQKQQVVRESIRTYLDTYGKDLDVARLSADIRERQTDKVFILWTLREFIKDTLQDDELEITHVERVKNGNTLIAVSKAGTRHNMLLRWKNHLGVMFPAWQISLTR